MDSKYLFKYFTLRRQLYILSGKVKNMAKVTRTRDKTPPLMSSAGIMRYFEEEKAKVKISPKTVLLAGFLTFVLVMVLNAYYGLWPRT